MYHHLPKLFSKNNGQALHCSNILKLVSFFSYLHSPSQILSSNLDLDQDIPNLRRNEGQVGSLDYTNSLELSHPWPEWTALIEHLTIKGYLNDDVLARKEFNRIRTACLNFARERFDIIEYFSHKDIKLLVESGCPSIDRKVVNSGKRLRARLRLDERNVCSSCSLRGCCDRAYVKARYEESGRTVDIMRILLTYGLDTANGPAVNKLIMSRQFEFSTRRLLSEMLKYSTKEYDCEQTPEENILPRELNVMKSKKDSPVQYQGLKFDWVCPKCNFDNFARNIKCLSCDHFPKERYANMWENQAHLPMKRGDWLCEICNFLNFANNTSCWLCKQKPPKRQLDNGDWECDSCYYINFKRNSACKKCKWRRPKASDSYTSVPIEGRQSNMSKEVKFNKYEQKVYEDFYKQSSFVNGEYYSDESNFSWSSEDDEHNSVESTSSRNSVKDDDNCSSKNIHDFPIVGGKSAVSRNRQAREIWKSQMSSSSKYVRDT